MKLRSYILNGMGLRLVKAMGYSCARHVKCIESACSQK